MSLLEGVRDRRIGSLLLNQGLITERDLRRAIAEQQREGGTVGLHLVLDGAVSRRDLYASLADQWGLELTDLMRHPPQSFAFDEHEPRVWVDEGWIPWRQRGDELIVATSVAPTDRVAQRVREITGRSEVSFVATTDWDIMRASQDTGREQLLHTITDKMADSAPWASARGGVAVWQKAAPIVGMGAVLVAAVIWPTTVIVVLFFVLNFIFCLQIIFKVLFGLRAPYRFWKKRNWERTLARVRAQEGLESPAARRMSDDELPIYTILVPVYDEVAVVRKVIAHLDRLDYPKSKLDVMILLEERDEHTIAAAKASNPPEYVRIVVVPEGQPQTKPRACNYGLAFARGEYVVIFDAEDRPHPDQLRKAIHAFEMNRVLREEVDPYLPPLVCVQASLMYFNAEYNLLTRMFALEYAHWFDLMLPGLDDSGLPLPLGGTSNHFLTDVLRSLGGWDPYNVTEDADLGLRIASQNFAVGTIESATEEEATSATWAWIRQRTRWIKGYMVTSAVNTRHPLRWYRVNGIGGLMTMICLVLGTPLAFLAYPLAWLFTIATYVGVKTGDLSFPPWVLVAGVLLLVGGNSSMIVSSFYAGWRRYNIRVAAYSPLLPLYWFLHSIAAWRAVYQMLFDPFTWEKTPHGLTEDYESSHRS